MITVAWLKALHVIFMVAWFAGIFYLPRLFVNHAETNNDDIAEHLKGMEKRLLYFITPFAVLTLIFGISIIYSYGMEWFKVSYWLHIKLILVLCLYAYHAYCFKILSDFKHNKNQRSGKFYRLFNEIPVFALFAVVILAYVKPNF